MGKPLTLLQELQYLEKEFNISFETIELDDIEGEQLHVRSNEAPIQSPTVKMGKILVFCYLSQLPLRIAFRLSSKAEYEQAILDRNYREKIVHASFFEKFRSYGIGLEDVEVLSDQDLDNYESIIKITSFSTDLGVGISGNMVQISDILRYTFNDVLKNNN